MRNSTRLKRQVIASRQLLIVQKNSITSTTKTLRLYKIIEDTIFDSLNKRGEKEKYFIRRDGTFKKASNYAVVLHLFYADNWELHFKTKLEQLASQTKFDLFVTLPLDNAQQISQIRKYFKQANFLFVPNRGRDVLPFIKTAYLLKKMGYRKVLKIHSKKSTHREVSNTAVAGSGNLWLSNTLDALIPKDNKTLKELLKKVGDKNTGLIGAMEYYYPLKMYLRNNRRIIERIIKKYVSDDFFTAAVSKNLAELGYFGGTMFWIDLDCIAEVLTISKQNFQKENGQFDGTTAHALERVFCILPQIKGKNVYGVSDSKLTKITGAAGAYPDWYYGDISGGKPPISIIVPVYADWSSLSKNITSLRKIVGNSEDTSVHYVNDCGPEADYLEKNILERLKGLTNFYYHRNDRNLGFVQTCNMAVLKLVNQKDDVLLLNSDTKATNNFLVEMRKTLYSEDRIGAVTARSNNATVWSVPMNGRLANHKLASYALYLYMKNKIPTKYIAPTIHGFCALIRREVISKYKLFDEVYSRGYGEENDFAMRIRRKGWKCAVANGAFVFHYESRSFGDKERNIQIEKNEKILVDRYPEYRGLVQEYWDSIKEPLK